MTPQRALSSSLGPHGYSGKLAASILEEDSAESGHTCALVSPLSQASYLQNHEMLTAVVHKPPSLGHFAIPVQVDRPPSGFGLSHVRFILFPCFCTNMNPLPLGCCCWVTQSCPTLWDPMDCNTSGSPVLHHFPEFAQIHAHWVYDAIQPFHLLSFPLLPSVFPSIRVFSNESALRIRWPKYWSFSCSISPSNEYSGLISFKIDWFDLLAVQETLKSLLQHHSRKESMLWHSAFFIVHLSHPYMTTGKNHSFDYAAAAKSLQSCLTLCNPIDGSPPGSSVPGILQARTLEWVAISFSKAWKWKVKVKSLSHVRLCSLPGSSIHWFIPGKSPGVGCHCLLRALTIWTCFLIHWPLEVDNRSCFKAGEGAPSRSFSETGSAATQCESSTSHWMGPSPLSRSNIKQ